MVMVFSVTLLWGYHFFLFFLYHTVGRFGKHDGDGGFFGEKEVLVSGGWWAAVPALAFWVACSLSCSLGQGGVLIVMRVPVRNLGCWGL